MVLSIFAVLGLALFMVCYWFAWRPKLRYRKMAPTLEMLSSLEAEMQGVPISQQGQAKLSEQLGAWRSLEASFGRAVDQAKILSVPIPALSSDTETTESTLRRILALLNEPSVTLAAAGGEQLLHSFADMLTPDAAIHIAEATKLLWDDGFIQASINAAQHGLPSALSQYATTHFIHNALEQHALSLHALTEIPHATAETLHQAGSELGQALDPTAVHSFHFPVATMILSTIRETQLVLDERTSLARAAGHVAVDTISTAGGGVLGGKLGGFAGILGGPPGIAAGMLIGSAAGAVLGRLFSGKVKAIPLNKAIDEYKSTFYKISADLQKSAHQVARTVHHEAHQANDAYHAALVDHPSISEVLATDDYITTELDQFSRRTTSILQDQFQRLENKIIRIESSLPQANLTEKLFSLNVRTELIHKIDAFRSKAWVWRNELIASLPKPGTHTLTALTLIASSPTLPIPDSSFSPLLKATGKFKDRYLKVTAEWLARASVLYRTAIATVAETVTKETERHQRTLTTCKEKLSAGEALVIAERRALGLE